MKSYSVEMNYNTCSLDHITLAEHPDTKEKSPGRPLGHSKVRASTKEESPYMRLKTDVLCCRANQEGIGADAKGKKNMIKTDPTECP